MNASLFLCCAVEPTGSMLLTAYYLKICTRHSVLLRTWAQAGLLTACDVTSPTAGLSLDTHVVPSSVPPIATRPTISIPGLAGRCRAGDLALMIVAAIVTTTLLGCGHVLPPWGELTCVSVIAIAVARFMAERQKLYDLPAMLDLAGQLRRVWLCMATGAFVELATLLVLNGHHNDASHQILEPFAWTLAGSAALVSVRSFLAVRLHGYAKAGRLSTRVAIVGANAACVRFIERAANDPSIVIVGVFDDNAADFQPDPALARWLRGDVRALLAFAGAYPLDAIVIALPDDAGRIDGLLRRLIGIAVDLYSTTEITPPPPTVSGLATLGSNSVICLSHRPLKDWPAFRKAAFDRVAGAAILLMILPLMLLVALIIKIDSPGPVIYRQMREGLNGTLFTMFKFRTMHAARRFDESRQATRYDPRVTRAGRWLRRFSLDELPQVWNVLRGDMSLVGPRPHLPTTRAGNRLFSEIVPDYQARHRVKPGLTGWAQVQGLRGETRTEQDIVDRVEHDLYYIDHWSLGLDLEIIFRTISKELFVSRSGRAY